MGDFRCLDFRYHNIKFDRLVFKNPKTITKRSKIKKLEYCEGHDFGPRRIYRELYKTVLIIESKNSDLRGVVFAKLKKIKNMVQKFAH